MKLSCLGYEARGPGQFQSFAAEPSMSDHRSVLMQKNSPHHHDQPELDLAALFLAAHALFADRIAAQATSRVSGRSARPWRGRPRGLVPGRAGPWRGRGPGRADEPNGEIGKPYRHWSGGRRSVGASVSEEFGGSCEFTAGRRAVCRCTNSVSSCCGETDNGEAAVRSHTPSDSERQRGVM
jgi:hypothetical protein